MTITETKRIIAVIVATYPNYHPDDIDTTVQIWHEVLEDYSYRQIDNALKRYIKAESKGFAPSIGQIIEKIPTGVPEITETEAWSMVSKALRNSAYNYQAEYDALPPAVQRSVGSAEQLHYWAIDEDYNEGVIMSHVISAYRAAAAQEREYARLPQNMQQLTAETVKQLENRT